MNIAHIITKSNWGGAQRYVYDMATELHGKPSLEDQNINDVVTVLCGGKGELVKRLGDAGIETVSIPFLERDINFLSDIKTAHFLYKWIKKNQPQVIHLNSSKIGGIGALAARLASFSYSNLNSDLDSDSKIKSKKPHIIFTAHGWAFNENRSIISRTFIKISYWITLLLSHKTICVSETMKKAVQNFPFVQSKVVVIHNGISNQHANKILEREAARAEIKMKLESDLSSPITPWIGNIAELHPVKGHLHLIESMNNLKISYGAQTALPYLFIIGEGEMRNILEETISKYGLEKHVFLLGHIKNASTLLQAFDMFILPSFSEGLGYVLLEAGLAQLPVVASNVGGIPEIIEQEKTGLLVSVIQANKNNWLLENAKGFAGAINKMLGKSDLRTSCARALHEKVLSEFSLEEMVEKTRKIYRT